MIQDCEDPMELHDAMEARHLVMKTNLHAKEFIGITIFLNSCPELESLTFDMDTTERILVSFYFQYTYRHYYLVKNA